MIERMQTSPVLARRVIPLRERLQKALLVLVLTVALVGGAWVFLGLSQDSDPRNLAIAVTLSVVGLACTLYFAFKKHETATTKEGNRAIRERIGDDRSGAGWTARLAYNIKRLLFGIFVLSGLLVSLAGVGVIAFQVYGYLRYGEWQSVSTFTTAVEFVPWLRNPQSWIGLYKILRQLLELTPLSLALILTGWLIAGFGSRLRDRVSR